MNFAQYWQYTDLVTKSLFFILILLSIVSWIVGILRIIASQKLTKAIANELRDHITANQPSMGSLDAESRKNVTEQLLLQYINRYRFDSEKGLSLLGTTAAIAPFIGLFGTVWGVFHALNSIANTGQAGLAQVAGPVGESLIMTGLGLSVAIPAVVFYNIAVRLNRKAIHQANDVAHQLLADSLIGSSVKNTANFIQTSNRGQ